MLGWMVDLHDHWDDDDDADPSPDHPLLIRLSFTGKSGVFLEKSFFFINAKIGILK